MSDKKAFVWTKGGKVAVKGCPYEDTSRSSPLLTAEEYVSIRKCQCPYCWKNQPLYGWVRRADEWVRRAEWVNDE